MLVNKPYEEHDVVTFKLVNGDEIVASYESETASVFYVKQPVLVAMTERGLGLIQALFTGSVKTSIPLNKDHVVMHTLTADQVSDHYTQTTSGIQPVRNKIVV
jgi:hypothetical protein